MDYRFKIIIMNLTITQIKKFTYKQRPKAILKRIRMGVAYYTFPIFIETKDPADEINELLEQKKITSEEAKEALERDVLDWRLIYEFQVPVSDMGEADFFTEMEAKHLLRWLVSETPVAFQTVRQEI